MSIDKNQVAIIGNPQGLIIQAKTRAYIPSDVSPSMKKKILTSKTTNAMIPNIVKEIDNKSLKIERVIVSNMRNGVRTILKNFI